MNNTKQLVERADIAIGEIDALLGLLHPDDAKQYLAANTHYHLIKDLRDYISGMGWRDIKSAPKDGTLILVAIFELGEIKFAQMAFYLRGWALPFDGERDEAGTPYMDKQPTHWQHVITETNNG